MNATVIDQSEQAPDAWPAIATLAHREIRRFLRQRNRVFGALAQPIIFWILFSEGLRSRELDYAHFFPGTLVMILLFTAIFATISIIEDRNEGFLQAVLVSPAPRWAIVLGKVFGGASIAMLQGLVFLGLGLATISRPDSVASLAMGVTLMAVIAVALTALGVAIAWRMESTHGFHAIMSVFLLPMWLLSGAFFPAGEAGWLGWVIRVNPLTYGVAGLRQTLVPEHSLVATSVVEGRAPADRVLVAVRRPPPVPRCWSITGPFAPAMLVLAWRVAAAGSFKDAT